MKCAWCERPYFWTARFTQPTLTGGYPDLFAPRPPTVESECTLCGARNSHAAPSGGAQGILLSRLVQPGVEHLRAHPEPGRFDRFLSILGGAALGYLIYRAITPSGEVRYHCSSCGGFVSREQKKCSKCGSRLR